MSMSDNILPQRKTPKLIVVTAFDRDESGDLQAEIGEAQPGKSTLPNSSACWSGWSVVALLVAPIG
ncbi:MAG: hypothetical protein EOR01_23035 [Mesorhizobium sp.]|nr:MAG: hypothetical protein EOR01_23035 [Mesorhizobium sp.]